MRRAQLALHDLQANYWELEMKYDVYFNRRKMKKDGKRVYSIRGCSGQYKAKVRWTNQCVLLKNVQFVVQEAGRLDTLARIADGRSRGIFAKTVHAFVRGTVLYRGRNALSRARSLDFLKPNIDNIEITYNPLINKSFVDKSGSPIFIAPLVLCSPNAVIAVNNPHTVAALKF
jgi:hypothetical protein